MTRDRPPDTRPDTRPLRHEIPTHLDVQDRLILGLSSRQTMLLMAGLAATYAAWSHLSAGSPAPPLVCVAAAAACVMLTAAVVWVRPHRRGVEEWAFVLVRYAALPKTAVWRQDGGAHRPTSGPRIPDDEWVELFSARLPAPTQPAASRGGPRPSRPHGAGPVPR